MPDSLDDRLAALGDTGPVSLAPAGDVRARGLQRRHRRRALLSATGAVVLAAAVGSTALALTGDRQDSLGPAPFATPSGGPSESPSPTPSAAVAPASFDVTRGLLAPSDAERTDDKGQWAVAAAAPEPGPLFSACGPGAFPLAERIAASAERRLVASRSDDGSSDLDQEVFRYDTAASAAAAFDAYADRAAGCAPRSQPEGGFVQVDVAERTAGTDEKRLLVELRTCQELERCVAVYAAWEMVVQRGDALTVVAYAMAADGAPPVTTARSVLAVTADKLRTATGGSAPVVTTAPATTAATSAPTKPVEVQPTQGSTVFGVYLAVAKDPVSTAKRSELAKARADVEALGYTPSGGDLGCDQGAQAALGLDPDSSYTREAVYFEDRATAQQFVDFYEPGVVGTAEVKTFCLD